MADDADWFAERVGEEFVWRRAGQRNGVAFDLGGPSGVVAKIFDGERNVGDARDGERFSVVERFDLREFFEMLFEEIGELPHHAGASGGRSLGPLAGFERGAGGFYGAVDVFAVAFGDVGEDFAGGGVIGGESLAGSGIDPLAVDEHLALFG